ncbi:hypothetical protein VTH82DRAFT_5694 [Thermothelomyces myriococcoides]
MLPELDKAGPSGRASQPVSNGDRAVRDQSLAGSGGTNKTHNDATRSVRSNGNVADPQQDNFYGHSREEVTRILIQALRDLGYHAAAASVSEESGFQVETPDVVAFRQAVLGGSWTKAEELLCGGGTRGAGHGSGSGLVLAPGADRNDMRFKLRRQKFLELLEQRETGRALAVLRHELTPLCQDHATLNLLSRLLMCQDADDLRSRADWDGANGRSRQLLLAELSESISPSVMLPDRRLAVLLDDVKRSQVERCRYHTNDAQPSLCVDHFCDRSRFPSEVLVELSHPGAESSKKLDEIWQVRFSPDGKHLATCGTDEAVCIWDVERLALFHQLHGHQKAGIGNVAWSPDSKLLITCSLDHTAKLWSAETGECLADLRDFGEPVSSCVWAADGQSFITGSFDKNRSMKMWDLRGNLLYAWENNHRTGDLALSRDQRWLVAMDERCTLHFYDFPTKGHVYDLTLDPRDSVLKASSVSISRDSRHLLVNLTDNEALLIDMETRETVQKYTGQKGGHFTIRSDFGGANENFVISGSEDGHVFIWHKVTGILVQEAEAHHTSCNAAAWNPTDPCMFATAGDDGRVKIWSNRERARALASAARQSNGIAARASNGSMASGEMWH